MVVLREKRTNKPLNVAFTEEGLQWTANKSGRAIYFRSAVFRNGKIEGKDMRVSPFVYVEKFKPNLDPSNRFIKEELLWLKKAEMLKRYA
jgi:hypothetical protein